MTKKQRPKLPASGGSYLRINGELVRQERETRDTAPHDAPKPSPKRKRVKK